MIQLCIRFLGVLQTDIWFEILVLLLYLKELILTAMNGCLAYSLLKDAVKQMLEEAEV